VATLLSLTTATVHAEKADREKPVNIEADRMSLDDLRKESVFEGNVVLTQGTLTIKADRVTVKQDPQGFTFGLALGKPASFRQKREGFDEYVEGFGERVEYDGKGDKVQLFTNARVKRGDDEVKGDYISYNAATEFYEVIGSKGSTTASTTGPSQRVKAVIQPKKKAIDTPSGGGAALKSSTSVREQ
jgi:lipopolysaccharide export system protein LptA